MFEIQDDHVLKVEDVITNVQTAIVREFYDMVYHTKLSYENGIVTAKIYNYLDELQDSYNNPVSFLLDNNETIVQASNGVATISFSSDVAGEYVIKTNIPNFRNGEVVWNVNTKLDKNYRGCCLNSTGVK